jgi:hypothetical protein
VVESRVTIWLKIDRVLLVHESNRWDSRWVASKSEKRIALLQNCGVRVGRADPSVDPRGAEHRSERPRADAE